MLPACDGVKEKQKHTDNVYEMLIINLFTLVLLGFNYIYCYNDPQRLFIYSFRHIFTNHYFTDPFRWISEINNYEKQVYSQNGEDGVLEFIFENIGTTNKIYVELGTEDAKECNTRYLR